MKKLITSNFNIIQKSLIRTQTSINPECTVHKFKFAEKPQKILIYNKETAYESLLAKNINIKNSPHYNIDKLTTAHKDHCYHKNLVYEALEKFGIEKENIQSVTTRQEGLGKLHYKKQFDKPSKFKSVFRPDLVIAIGGDGTFLRATHLLHQELGTLYTPIVGINSNPNFSEGRLCLPNDTDIMGAISKIVNGEEVGIMKRQRIRIHVKTDNFQNLITRDYYKELPVDTSALECSNVYSKTLPILALNDVFIGERASSMVSHLDITYKYYPSQLDWVEHPPQKNSGLIACTGTGSTGWSKSINRIGSEEIRTVAHQLNLSTAHGIDYEKLADALNNERTVFDPEAPTMGLTFREPIFSKISTGTYSNFVKTAEIHVRVKCFQGMIAIDGSTYYSVTPGTELTLELNKAWQINCIHVD